MAVSLLTIASLASVALAIPAQHDSTSRCSTTAIGLPTTSHPQTCSATRTASYSSFTYTALTTTRYATAVPSPLVLTTTYAPPFSQVSSLLPTGQTYTSYSLDRNATGLQDGQYGQGAYARLWSTLSYNSTVPFTSTVTPTPIASSELVFPPALYTPCPQQADACLDCYKFPKDFLWGVAGSAWQIEGAAFEDGRGPSTLDQIGALGGPEDTVNAVVSDMNYYLYKQDIARLAAIGVPNYSFSISWTRVVPFGIAGSPINTAALEHYDDLINTCIEYGVRPIVTLSHADPPLLHSYNTTEFAESFLYYAKEVMTRYSDRVSHWVTLNEPNIAYPGQTTFSAVPNILHAHASVYHWYKGELKGTGLVTIKFANNLAVPLDNENDDDIRAALRYQDFILGILGNPIFLGEQIPEEVLNTSGLNLTALTADELSYFNGTADFWSFDPYTAGFATSPPGGIDACAKNQSDPLWPNCVVNTNVQTDGWLNGQGSYAYAYIAPQYVRQQLGYIWNIFKPSGILIAEFGFNPFMESSKTVVAQLYDLERTLYYYAFLRETLKSIYEDNVNVIGALAWSFLDNNEFGSYDQQYGLQHVNRTNGEFTRSFKRSIFDYVDFFHQYVEQ
ncbi:hypothetical protein CKM354_000278800 [Cercospora kikuchii]|uniref:Beta-glucosidase n=1 Tax=Cercospora kikuchii TaxID=84275 RepID=A0A9P3CIY4_9PEZI|nr:uncharacterized protein CKM354_000278800 [Cercospora kikuchii]GIZ39403.1 hypothetical protein CKM354_000278800 [Cercospora kikuchii]